MLKVVIIGAVNSTYLTLEALIRHHVPVTLALGLTPKNPELVSGYCDLQPLCTAHDIPFCAFLKVNDPEVVNKVRAAEPDVLFVVGLSQLVGRELLGIPRLGSIGFHPTSLPRGRGRAPIAWLVIERAVGAASFFLMGEGTDDGPIFVQQPFVIGDQDDAGSTEKKLLAAMATALDHWLPRLIAGEWNPIPQDATTATYFCKRAPEDGLVDWQCSADVLDRLIKAAAPPHPGAFTFFQDKRLRITRCHIESDLKIMVTEGVVLFRVQNFE